MEKPLAEAAGLGWQGKHTNLVSREFGSWLFLGAIFTTLELPPDAPDARSLRHLPRLPRRLPDRRVSRRPTGSMRGAASPISPSSTRAPIPRELRAAMGNRIYGCDDCLAVCPWNKFAQAGREAKLARARRCCARRRWPSWRGSTTPASARCSPRRAVKRIGRDRFVRNVLIAIGNSGDAALAGEAERLLGDASPLVRGAAVWALGRLDRARLERCSGATSRAETDPEVVAEWAAACE